MVALTGLSQKNAERLRRDIAVAFLEKSDLGLDKGSEALLTALAEIVLKLNLEVPATGRERSESSVLNAGNSPVTYHLSPFIP